MASSIDICSNALLMLGSKPIASFDEGSAPANLDRGRLCSNLYPMMKLALLRSHPWNCAVTRVQLSPDATPPAFGFRNRFLLPGNWLRTLEVGDGYALTYRSEGRYLLCDEAVFPLVYLRDVPETDFDSMLVEAMTLAMAMRLAYAITASSAVEQARYSEFQALMKRVRAVDGQDDPPQTFGDMRLLTSRFGNNGAFGD